MNAIKSVLGGLAFAACAANSWGAAVLIGGCSTDDFTTSTSCSGIYDPGNDNGTHDIFENADFQAAYGTGWTLWKELGDFGGGTSGEWSVDGWEHTSVLAILKAGDHAAAYIVDLNVTSGEWDISGSNWCIAKRNGCSNNGLSHLNLWVKNPTEVPVPGTLGLLGLGLAGLGLVRRRTAR